MTTKILSAVIASALINGLDTLYRVGVAVVALRYFEVIP